MQEYSQEAVDAEVQKMTADQKVPNILICGNNGVGKSSAVNYLFNDEVADTSVGEPCTTDITLYRHEDVNIYDSAGYEIGGEKQARYEKMLFDDFLLPRQGSIGDDAVHLVWYAVSGAGAKFTDLDAALVRRIEKAGYPAAVLLTKIDEMTETQLVQMIGAIKKDAGGVPIFPVSIWAKDESNYPGLAQYCKWDELIQWSYDHLAGVFKTRFVAALRGGLELKRRQAAAAVAAATVGAGAVGLVPIPFSDAALLSPIQIGLLLGIAKIYGIQISKAAISSSAIAIVTTAVGKSLVKLVPFVGPIVNATVAVTITGALGAAFSELCYKQCKDQLEGKPVTIDIEKILTASDFIAEVFRRVKEAKENRESSMNAPINVLLLGSTGVGKSSLINYLYGSEVAKTGAGKPVTPPGEFQEVTVASPLKPDVRITFFDSWGIEANQGEIWKQAIDEKLEAALSFEHMIGGIIYCFSYNGRIQDFEIDHIKELLERKFRVIIALTKADNANYKALREEFRRILDRRLAGFSGEYTAVDICAQAEPKLGQSAAGEVFGRDELFSALQRDWGVNFRTVILARFAEWKRVYLDKIRNLRHYFLASIDEFDGDWWKTKPQKAKEIHDEMAGKLTELHQQAFVKFSADLNEAGALYERFTGAFSTDFFSEENIKRLNIIAFFRKIVDFGYHFTEKVELQEDLRMVLINATEDFEDRVNKAYEEAEKTLWEAK